LSVTGPGNGIEAPNSSVLIVDSNISGNTKAGGVRQTDPRHSGTAFGIVQFRLRINSA
jgi:hypothetical protein